MAAAMARRISRMRSVTGVAVAVRTFAAASTSAIVMEPWAPLPVRTFTSMPSTCARLRAAGDTHLRRLAVAAGWAASVGARSVGSGARAGAPASASGAAAERAAVAATGSTVASSGGCNVASRVPTRIFWPGCTASSSTTPSLQISTSTAALEVSTTATTWPRCTRSPGFMRHSRRVPESMSAPSAGNSKRIMSPYRTRRAPRQRCRPAAAAQPPPSGGHRAPEPPGCRRAPAARRARRKPARRCAP